MIDRILLILADNPAGLTPAQLLGALGIDAFPRDDLGTLIADGRAVLDTSSGVDVYRLGAPVAAAPKPKAAPTSRMAPIALLDGLAEAVSLPRGTALADIATEVAKMRAEIERLRCDDSDYYAALAPLLTRLANAVNGQIHDSLAELVQQAEFMRSAHDLLMERANAAPSTSPTLPDGWRARYERTAPSGVDLAVVPNSAGWSWSIIDGAQTLARGVVEVDDPVKAIGCCDAVAAVLA